MGAVVRGKHCVVSPDEIDGTLLYRGKGGLPKNSSVFTICLLLYMILLLFLSFFPFLDFFLTVFLLQNFRDVPH